jgi:hypothetical protein
MARAFFEIIQRTSGSPAPKKTVLRLPGSIPGGSPCSSSSSPLHTRFFGVSRTKTRHLGVIKGGEGCLILSHPESARGLVQSKNASASDGAKDLPPSPGLRQLSGAFPGNGQMPGCLPLQNTWAPRLLLIPPPATYLFKSMISTKLVRLYYFAELFSQLETLFQKEKSRQMSPFAGN